MIEPTFINAYKAYRNNIIRDCNKHNLDDDCELYADEIINRLSNTEFMKEILLWYEILNDQYDYEQNH